MKKRLVGIDTGFLLALLRGRKRAVEEWERILEEGIPVVSVIVLLELELLRHRGILNPEAVSLLKEMILLRCRVVEVDEEIAGLAANINHGTGMSVVDALICASYYNCDLVYTDRDVFKKVFPKHRPLLVMV